MLTYLDDMKWTALLSTYLILLGISKPNQTLVRLSSDSFALPVRLIAFLEGRPSESSRSRWTNVTMTSHASPVTPNILHLCFYCMSLMCNSKELIPWMCSVVVLHICPYIILLLFFSTFESFWCNLMFFWIPLALHQIIFYVVLDIISLFVIALGSIVLFFGVA